MGANSRIQHFPISFFAMVMGLTGLTLAWEKAESALGIGLALHVVLAFVALAAFAVLAALYCLKFMRYRQAVLRELRHPVKLNFFPAISISLVLLATTQLYIFPTLALILWIAGASMQLALTLYIMGVWIHHDHFEVNHINPAWFIPVVGNILVPIAGTTLGYPEISWFFFSFGIVFWIVLMTIIFYRVFFHHPLPDKLVPTFFILIAPPAVGSIAYIKLAGNVDSFARVLFYCALFLTLLLATQVRRFVRLQFFLSWWAYSFPLAAITVASFLMAEKLASEGIQLIATLLLLVLTALVFLLLFKTFKAANSGNICKPED